MLNSTAEETVKDYPRGDAGGMPDVESLKKFSPTEPPPKGGFFRNWGLQAIVDLILGGLALKRLYPLVPLTLVPIIKLCSDNREEVEAAYNIIRKQNEVVRFFDSPREKYRKIYGNFVREMEWACSELRRYFNKAAYEDLVINATADYLNLVLGSVISLMIKSMLFGKKLFEGKQSRLADLINKVMSRMTAISFEHVINITSWLAGDVEIKEYDFRECSMVMEFKDCLMLRAPRLKNLPEECCLLGCKGGCEKVFEKLPLGMTLDPRLPETTCEIRMFLADQQ